MRPRSAARPPAARLLLPAWAVALALSGLASVALAAPEKVAGGIRFTYTDANAGTVAWAGEFNGWNTTANPMTKGDGGVWSAVIPLPAGRQAYKFVVDGQWVADPENPVTAGEYGNSVVEVAADGGLVAQRATSNSPYNPKILIGGRIIGLYEGLYDRVSDRYTITRPTFDIDLGFEVRMSDLLKARVLLNVNPQNEDVQDYRSRLNYKRGSLQLTQPGVRLLAFDSEDLGTWDDPLHLVGNLGVFGHPYGYQRQGAQLGVQRYGFDARLMFSDNFDDRTNTNDVRYLGYHIDNFPTWTIGPDEQHPRFVFESVGSRDEFPVATAIGLLQTQRAGEGFALVPGQVAKLSTLDFGDNGRVFGYGDNYKDTFAARLLRELPGGLRLGLLGRTDRGYGMGRLVLAQPVADSSIQITSALYQQQWYGGGAEARWTPRENLGFYAEVLAGARRMTFANLASTATYPVDSILPGKATVRWSQATSRDAVGEHLTTDQSGRYALGGTWSFAQGDIGLRGGVERETHRYPAWTQAPVAPAGQASTDHQRFETVEFQRADYLEGARPLQNAMTTLRFGWDRNWRYYVAREVLTTIDFEWTSFDYDPRTAWESQMWFPTGSFWLENGQHLVSIDRLTVLGEKHVLRLRPRLEVPIRRRRDVRLVYQGTFSGTGFDTRPRYAETVLRFGFDVSGSVRFGSDVRWAKYDAPDLGLDRGYVSHFTGLKWRAAPSAWVSLGLGVNPEILDPVTNEYAYIGRDVYLNDRNANGFIAETNYLSLGPQIHAAELSMQDVKRIEVQAVVKF